MTWLKTDDKFPEHRKVRRLTDGAYRLHHTAMCACAKDETDGFVTAEDIADMEHGQRLARNIPALVAAGLWEVVPGGWLVHDFLHYNPSHAKLVAKREADRERQETYRKGKMKDPAPDLSQRDNGVVTALSHPLSQPPVPDPTRTRPVLVVAESLHGMQSADARDRDDAMRGAR